MAFPTNYSKKPILTAPLLTESDKNRFFSKIGYTAIEDRCWEWQGSHRGMGYGQFFLLQSGKETCVSATRTSFYIHNDIYPADKNVLHSCDNPKCVNPKHLFLGTLSDNTQDMLKKDRHNAEKGSNHHAAKLTEEKVLYIRSVYNGLNGKRLALKYNVSYAAIYDIVNRRRWKHI